MPRDDEIAASASRRGLLDSDLLVRSITDYDKLPPEMQELLHQIFEDLGINIETALQLLRRHGKHLEAKYINLATLARPPILRVAVATAASGAGALGAAEAGEANEPTKVTLKDLLNLLLLVAQKTISHSNVQTNIKLSCGAAAWQIAQLLTDSIDFWPRSLIVGLASMLGVNLGMYGTQLTLEYCSGGKPAAELLTTMAQLIPSVTIADGAWSETARLGLEMTRKISDPRLRALASIFSLATTFLIEAGLFTSAQNLTDAMTKALGNDSGFHSDAAFTTKVWGAYAGFYLFPWAIRFMSSNPVLIVVVAALGTAALPALLGRADYETATADLLEIFSQMQAAVMRSPASLESTGDAVEGKPSASGATIELVEESDTDTESKPQQKGTAGAAAPSMPKRGSIAAEVPSMPKGRSIAVPPQRQVPRYRRSCCVETCGFFKKAAEAPANGAYWVVRKASDAVSAARSWCGY